MARSAPLHRPHTYRAPKEVKREVDERRGTAASRGYGYKWQKRREIWIQAHPLCAHCEAEGITKAGNIVDHVIPHKGDMDLFWDEKNWQTLCKPHHDKKTMKEGSFGQ